MTNADLAKRAALWSAIAGVVTFVLGLGGVIYVMADSGRDGSFLYASGAQGKVYFALSTMPLVILASAFLWAIAVYIRVSLATRPRPAR